MLLEKASRDKKGVEEKKAAEEIEELHGKVSTSSIHGNRVVLLLIFNFLSSSLLITIR